MHVAVYPGSFDPCTNGHLDVIERSSLLFDKIIVCVLNNITKDYLFTFDQRIDMLNRVAQSIPNVEVTHYSGLLADFLLYVGAQAILKGVRTNSDFGYEFDMALINKKLCPNTETLFIPARSENIYLSSSYVKEVALYGGDISSFIPQEITDIVKNKFMEG